MSVSIFHPFFLLGCFSDIVYMNYLYILGIKLLTVASFLIIFSHSEGCLFILFKVSFAVQKLLNLIRFHFFVFIFVTLGGGSKRILLGFMSKSVLPVFSS